MEMHNSNNQVSVHQLYVPCVTFISTQVHIEKSSFSPLSVLNYAGQEQIRKELRPLWAVCQRFWGSPLAPQQPSLQVHYGVPDGNMERSQLLRWSNACQDSLSSNPLRFLWHMKQSRVGYPEEGANQATS